MELKPSRKLKLYLRTLEVALEDNIITSDEELILRVLANALGLPEEAPEICFSIAKGDVDPPLGMGSHNITSKELGDPATYQAVLIAALDDEVITGDEWALIEILRELMGIQSDEHTLIEEAIRESAPEDEKGTKRLERLENYLSRGV